MGKNAPNECLGYDTKKSDGEVPVMLELCEMQNVAFKLCTYAKLSCLK